MNRNAFSDGLVRKKTNLAFLSLIILILGGGCTCTPVLDDLEPSSGPPGTVVEVEGSRLALASVRWDANLSSEQTLPSSFLSARFFSVPLGASLGAHPVRLYGGGNYSDNTVNFDVTAGTIRPNPRLDDVTVAYFNISSSNKAAMILMAHGANIDVGAEIRINGTSYSTFFSRLLRNAGMNASDPSTLGYPIFNYGTVWCLLGDQTPGSDIIVSVENLDGLVSNSLTYHIAASLDGLDSDGDGLLDRWEENGYDADGDGTIDVDLSALGADPLRKDLFVEVDWMAAAAPNNAIWTAIENAFANSPILNSDGSQGVAIHIDRGPGTGGGGGDIIPYADGIRYDNNTPDATLSYVNFYTVKQGNFDPNRLNIFRYCVFAWDSGHSPGSSGQAEAILANDFFVSLGSWGANGQRADYQTGTFIHELGHTINLRHGGFENRNWKPNYNDIMNYRFQLSGIDTDCDIVGDGVYTHSQGQRRDLNENSLDEGAGVCDNVAQDWNGNGTFQASISADINADGILSVLRDHASWANIELDFRVPGSGWNNN